MTIPALNTEEFQYLDDGILLNGGETIPFIDVIKISGLDSTDLRTSSHDRENVDGGYIDAFYEGIRTVILEGTVYTNSQFMESFLDSLKANYAPQKLPKPFYFGTDAGVRVVYGKPLGFKYDKEQLRRVGSCVFQLQMVCEDPRIYSPTIVTREMYLSSPPGNVQYEWVGTPNASESIEKIDGVEVRRNLLIRPNLSVAETGWNRGASIGFTSVPDGGQLTAVADIGANSTIIGAAAGNRPATSPGDPVSWRMRILNTGTSTVILRGGLQYYNGTTFVGPAVYGSLETTITPGNSGDVVVENAITPAGVDTVRPILTVFSSSGFLTGSQIVILDGIVLEEAETAGSPFSGNSTSNIGRGYDKSYRYGYGQGSTGSNALQFALGGNREAPAIIRIYGPILDPIVTNDDNGTIMKFSLTVNEGDYIEINLGNRSVTLNGNVGRRNALTLFGNWYLLKPGNNNFRLTGSNALTGTTKLQITANLAAWR